MTDNVSTECNLDQRIEVLRFISETHRKAREERRGAHAKAFFTTLTFFGVLASARFLDDFSSIPKSLAFSWFAWIAISFVSVIAVVHLLGLEAASRVNRTIAQDAEIELMKIVGLCQPTGAGKWIAQLYVWEAAMILAMAIVAATSLTVL